MKAGLDEVERDSDLFTYAQIRAEEMVRQTRTGHTRPEPPQDTEKKWPGNVNGKGVYNTPSVADELGIPYNWIWECAGADYQTPKSVVAGWMNSPPHAATLLREDIIRCGVGVCFTDKETPTGYSRFWAIWLD